LPSAGFPRDLHRVPQYVYLQTSETDLARGRDAIDKLFALHTTPPTETGGGFGHPSIPSTFVIPSVPDTHQGRLVVYRCLDESARISGTTYSPASLVVTLVGRYTSRHAYDPAAPEPDSTALLALQELVHDYILPRYRLKPKMLRAPFDENNPVGPGDFLETWVRQQRGESPNLPPGPSPAHVPLTSSQVRLVLQAQGFECNLGGTWSNLDAAGLRAFQRHHGLRPTGRHTHETDTKLIEVWKTLA
jgi:hypothetical protein